MTTCTATLVAAPASRQGKTTMPSALARLLALQGRRVRVFGWGLDFLEPYQDAVPIGASVYPLLPKTKPGQT